MKPLLSVAHYFGHWRYRNDYKKINLWSPGDLFPAGEDR